jgi:hypothetical protein
MAACHRYQEVTLRYIGVGDTSHKATFGQSYLGSVVGDTVLASDRMLQTETAEKCGSNHDST